VIGCNPITVVAPDASIGNSNTTRDGTRSIRIIETTANRVDPAIHDQGSGIGTVLLVRQCRDVPVSPRPAAPARAGGSAMTEDILGAAALPCARGARWSPSTHWIRGVVLATAVTKVQTAGNSRSSVASIAVA
jgi:hypothetical protein